MSYKNNKQQFVLSLFLLLSTTIQCMNTTTKVVVMRKQQPVEKLQKKYNFLKQVMPDHYFITYGVPEKDHGLVLTCRIVDLTRDALKSRLFLTYIYFHDYKSATYNPNNDRFTLDHLKKNDALLQLCKNAYLEYPLLSISKCSALGVATIAPNLSYEEAKDFTQQLLALGFTPTLQDKELACLEKEKRRDKTFLQKMCLLYCANSNDTTGLLSALPRELVNYISLLAFKTQESLF